MLGTNIGGDLATLGSLAQWLRDTSMKVDRAAETMRRMRETAYEHWTDDAGEYFAEQLRIGEKNAHHMVDALQRLARLISDCYDGLARAQELMTEAEQVALAGGLTVRDRIIIPPTVADRPISNIPIYDTEDLQTWHHLRTEAYQQAENLVERACQILLDLLDRLSDQSDWSTLYFTLGDITRGELELLAHLNQQTFASFADDSTSRALRANREIDWHSRRALKGGSWRAVDYAIDRKLQEQDLSRLYAAKASRSGMIVKVLRASGPVLPVASVAYDIYVSDSPVRKALLSAGVGTITGALVIGFFGSGPVVIVAAGIASLAASIEAGSWYDEVEPAKERIAREQRRLGTGPVELD